MKLTEYEIFTTPVDQHLALIKKNPEMPIYVYLNPVEYHGPHLSLHNDFILARSFAALLHTQRFSHIPFIQAPAIHFGHGPASGAGSVSTSYPDLQNILIAMVKGIWQLGYRNFIFMTFHGDPLHNLAIWKAVKFVISKGGQAMAPFNLVLHEFMDYQADNFKEILPLLSVPDSEKQKILENLYLDFHAGAFETSLVLSLSPDNVDENYKNLPAAGNFTPNFIFSALSKLAGSIGQKKLKNELNFAANGLGWSLGPEYRGYTGFPALASKELGDYFVYKKILPMYLQEVENVFERKQAPTGPIMSWVAPLSLGGRIAP